MTEKIPFGPADIMVGEGADAINFDGKATSGEQGTSQLQAEGGSINIEPTFASITSIDYGEGDYDQYTTGVNVTVNIVALKESVKTLKLAIASTQEVTDATTSEVTGLTDAPVGQSNREKGVPVRIHPRNMGDDKSLDYVVYKMSPVENYERPFSLEQGTVNIQLKAYPRDGADASKGANFYYTGAVDPNAEVTP
ncbi:hypothetical protein J4760_04045 [Salinicoccus sp. ID82-1]|uniref:hypothetical protein n=1 Tax=Salinicoccus sp. ID82-1 TaxID=2820269 RepID=UPI001F21FFD4|nr:hypothetical protein [Salinicoccus sp. ID82-1]MCG1009223.1 hypothetical protein [Salinicoccus sp. ID82-1]